MLSSFEPANSSATTRAASTINQRRRLRGAPTSITFLLNSESSSIAAIIVLPYGKGKARLAVGRSASCLLALLQRVFEERRDFADVTLRVGLIGVAVNL